MRAGHKAILCAIGSAILFTAACSDDGTSVDPVYREGYMVRTVVSRQVGQVVYANCMFGVCRYDVRIGTITVKKMRGYELEPLR